MQTAPYAVAVVHAAISIVSLADLFCKTPKRVNIMPKKDRSASGMG
jgi:hypothetical protein